MEWRSIYVDDHFSARRRLAPGRSSRQPDVFADVDTDDRPVDRDERQTTTGMEIAALVEDAVIREVPLGITGHDPSLGDDGCGVIEFMTPGRQDGFSCYLLIRETALSDVSDHRDALSAHSNNLVECTAVICNKLRFQQQIFRRIAGDRE